MVNNFFSLKNRTFYEMMWNNIVEAYRSHIKIQYDAFAFHVG